MSSGPLLLAMTLLALAGCHSRFLPEAVSLRDPRVQPLLAAMAEVDRTALGFTPLSTNARLTLEFSSVRAYDAMLHVYGETSRTIAFRRNEAGYRWIGEQEIHQGPRWLQTVDGTFRESILVEYQTERINGIPTNQLTIRYTGSDPGLIAREFTLAEVRPILSEWRTAAVEAKPSDSFDEGFDPALLMLALVMLCVFIVVCCLAVVVVLVCLVAGAVLLALGIVSASVLVGILRRSVSAGFRAAFLQLGAVLGLLCGAITVLLSAWITHAPLDSVLRWVTGGFGGLLVGVLLAWLFNLAWTRIVQMLARKLGKRASPG